MGIELKKVPLDFQWEIGKVWCGYVNPHQIHKCKECNGNRESNEFQELLNEWYSSNNGEYKPNPFVKDCIYNTKAWKNNLTDDDVQALLEADRLWEFTRMPLNDEQKEIVEQQIANGGNSWLPFNNGYIPTAKEVNDWNLKQHGYGHDSLNGLTCIKARLKREKKDYKCNSCKGTGENWQHHKAKSLYKNWKKYDPPTGKGFQLWTTTNEGSPMTPVFESLEKLCEYCETEKISVFCKSYSNKRRMV